MRPVNLLPEGDRDVRSMHQANGATIVLGVLGALLLAVLALVVTQNQINGRTGDIAEADQQAKVAQAKVEQLSSFGTFAAVKQARVDSVSKLAAARFDWERFMRELAIVLPDGTSLLQVSGSATGDQDTATASSASPATPTDSATVGSPIVTLSGCAKSQPKVAVLMVRLRRMYRVKDVELSDSTQADAAAGAATGPASGQAAGGADNTACGRGQYKFETKVTYSPAPTTDTGSTRKVPSRLGGGS